MNLALLGVPAALFLVAAMRFRDAMASGERAHDGQQELSKDIHSLDSDGTTTYLTVVEALRQMASKAALLCRISFIALVALSSTTAVCVFTGSPIFATLAAGTGAILAMTYSLLFASESGRLLRDAMAVEFLAHQAESDETVRSHLISMATGILRRERVPMIRMFSREAETEDVEVATGQE